jgi:thiamine pyrophosphate-dependent acetolactate synthase large subunit-like protein
VYGGHGGALVPLVNAVCNHPDLKWVCARNEHDAAEMAAAHAVGLKKKMIFVCFHDSIIQRMRI